MDLPLLLERFRGLVETPADVKRLEQTILQLAVMGKLVPQDPADEPAELLVERVKKAKLDLIKQGKLRKQKETNVSDNNSEIETFLPPKGWTLTSLGTLTTIKGGKRVPKGYTLSETPTKFIYIRVSDMKLGTILDTKLRYITEDVRKLISQYIIKSNELYLTIAGTIGAIGSVPEKFDGMNLTENAARIINYGANLDFLKLALWSPFIQNQFQNKVNQMAQPKLALARAKSTLVPLPPIEEQKRIVAKVDELFEQTAALSAELEAAQTGRTKAQFAAVHTLAQAPKAEQAAAWELLAQNFERLHTEPKHVDQLKQMILQLAVSGRLVAQDSADEPAGVLLERIAEEKARLVAEKKIKRGKPVESVSEDWNSKIPANWAWSRLNELLSGIKAGKSPQAQKQPAQKNEFGVLKVSAVSWGKFLPNENKALLPGTQTERIPTVEKGDVLISRANTKELVGAVVQAQNDYPNLLLSDKTLRLDFVCSAFSKPFMVLALRANWVREVFEEGAIGTSDSMRNISQNKIRFAPIAVPPLAEQKRIVAKVDELIGLCDKLASSLSTAEATRQKLLAAVLG